MTFFRKLKSASRGPLIGCISLPPSFLRPSNLFFSNLLSAPDLFLLSCLFLSSSARFFEILLLAFKEYKMDLTDSEMSVKILIIESCSGSSLPTSAFPGKSFCGLIFVVLAASLGVDFKEFADIFVFFAWGFLLPFLIFITSSLRTALLSSPLPFV